MLELKDVTYSYQNKSEAIFSKVNFIVLLGNLEREKRPYFPFWQVLIIPRRGRSCLTEKISRKKALVIIVDTMLRLFFKITISLIILHL